MTIFLWRINFTRECLLSTNKIFYKWGIQGDSSNDDYKSNEKEAWIKGHWFSLMGRKNESKDIDLIELAWFDRHYINGSAWQNFLRETDEANDNGHDKIKYRCKEGFGSDSMVEG